MVKLVVIKPHIIATVPRNQNGSITSPSIVLVFASEGDNAMDKFFKRLFNSGIANSKRKSNSTGGKCKIKNEKKQPPLYVKYREVEEVNLNGLL